MDIAIFLVQNEYLSVKKSYQYYNLGLYFLDLCSLSVYVLALSKLQNDGGWLQYDYSFWVVLSFLWLFYAAWDFVMLRFSPEYEQREFLFKWGIWMGLIFIASLFLSNYLGYLVENRSEQMRILGPAIYGNVLTLIQLILVSFALFALILWLNDLRASFDEVKPRATNNEDGGD